MLSVVLVVSAIPQVPAAAPLPSEPPVAATAVNARSVARIHSTNTDTVIVALRKKAANPAAAAVSAIRKAAWKVAGAKVVSSKALRADAATVTLNKSLTRKQADQIAAAAQKTAGVRYAEASVKFYPTEAGGDDYYWNIDQINASAAWATANTEGAPDVVVGVIDTGIADNALLPKALLLNTTNGKVGGTTISGTTWPGLTVKLNYTSGGDDSKTKETQASLESGNWSVNLDSIADDTTTLYASVTDASQTVTTNTEAVVNSSTNLKVDTPSNGKTFTGTVDTDAIVTVKVKDGDALCTEGVAVAATVPDTSSWNCTITPGLAHATVVEVTAIDALGNTATETITVDAEVTLNVDKPSDGNTITGTTDPGATVTFTQGTTAVCDNQRADADGKFTCSPALRLTDGAEVTVTTTDPVGNSASTTVKVNASVNLTVVTPSNGSSYSGTVDADATVTLTYPDGATQLADVSDGTWTVSSPASVPAHDGEVTVTARDGQGNHDSKIITVDSSVRLVLNPSSGKTLSGVTDPGATVSFAVGTTPACSDKIADADGEFSCTRSPRLADGTAVVVTSVDPLGNTTWATLTINAAVHLTVVTPSDGKTFSGTADTDATITVKVHEGDTLCDDLATTDGTWACTTASLDDGTVIDVTATDDLDNTETQQITVDAAAPSLEVSPSNGATISGTTDADATVQVKVVDGEILCADATVAADGSFLCTPSEPLADGTEVAVTASDALGNTIEYQLRVNASVNLTVVSPSDGKTFTGTVDTDATVTLKVHDGDPLCADGVTVTETGSWSCLVSPGLAHDTVVDVTATDEMGNTGTEPITVDAAVSLVLDPSDGTSITGTTDPGAIVAVSVTGENALCEALTADNDGKFTCTPSEQLPAATSVTVTSTDGVGNTTTGYVTTDDGSANEADPSGSATPNEVGAAETGTVPPVTTVPLTSTTVGSGTVLPGYDFVSASTTNGDGDGNGRDADATDPGIQLYTDPSQPRSSHGTHVAGIIAANGGSTLTGVAPGVKIQPIRALTSASGGSMADVAAAIRWAVGEPVAGVPANPYADQLDVLNLSLGAKTSCSVEMQSAIDAAIAHGTTVVVSAGNDNQSITNVSPANCRNVIVVTAADNGGTRSTYSNWGTSATSGSALVAGPGGSGNSTSTCYAWYPIGYQDLAGECTDQVVSTVAGSWMPKFGTSMAAPHVAGTAALLMSTNADLGPTQVAKIIQRTATPIPGCATGVCGTGIVNAAAALAEVDHPDTAVSAANYPAIGVQSVMSPHSTVGNVISVTASGGYPNFSYQWYRGSAPISGATKTWYQLVGSDYAQVVWAKVTTAGGGPSVASSKTSVTGKGSMSFLAKPKISGTVKVGKKLTATASYTPSYAHASPTFQWYRSGKKISKATKSTYKLTKKDRGKRITVKVTFRATGYITISRTSGKTKAVRR